MSRNYSELFDSFDAEMLQDMDNTITKLELWDWMKTYEPEEGKGFMFSFHPNIDLIRNNISYTGHSGSSYGWTMRTMELIAKKGWDNFKYERLAGNQFKQTEEYKKLNDLLRSSRGREDLETHFENQIKSEIKKLAKILKDKDTLKASNNPLLIAEALRDVLPDGEKQYQAIKNFSEGKISYSEMRGLSG